MGKHRRCRRPDRHERKLTSRIALAQVHIPAPVNLLDFLHMLLERSVRGFTAFVYQLATILGLACGLGLVVWAASSGIARILGAFSVNGTYPILIGVISALAAGGGSGFAVYRKLTAGVADRHRKDLPDEQDDEDKASQGDYEDQLVA